MGALRQEILDVVQRGLRDASDKLGAAAELIHIGRESPTYQANVLIRLLDDIRQLDTDIEEAVKWLRS